mmetsp:Transcript_11555/g.13298  ORF Transcript_11555/g.13298 Transcript_11555/m.13298 type:complete len:221 (-) Transcript_11555:537-1199(-)
MLNEVLGVYRTPQWYRAEVLCDPFLRLIRENIEELEQSCTEITRLVVIKLVHTNHFDVPGLISVVFRFLNYVKKFHVRHLEIMRCEEGRFRVHDPAVDIVGTTVKMNVTAVLVQRSSLNYHQSDVRSECKKHATDDIPFLSKHLNAQYEWVARIEVTQGKLLNARYHRVEDSRKTVPKPKSCHSVRNASKNLNQSKHRQPQEHKCRNNRCSTCEQNLQRV